MAVDKKSRKRPHSQSRRASMETTSRSKSRPRSVSDFFAWPHPIWMIAVIFGLYLLVQTTIRPHDIPDFLGPLRSFAFFMGTEHPTICVLLCVFATVAHCSEAAYAGKICHDSDMTTGATIKWVFSTFCFGFGSLIKLIYMGDTKKD